MIRTIDLNLGLHFDRSGFVFLVNKMAANIEHINKHIDSHIYCHSMGNWPKILFQSALK